MHDEDIDLIKTAFAGLLEHLEGLRVGRSEQARIAAIAITQLQTAELWALKAATWSAE